MKNIAAYKKSEETAGRLVKVYKMRLSALDKAERKLINELGDQLYIVTGCAGIALYENWGWREKRIAALYDAFNRVWDENSKDRDRSIIEVCREETGITVDIPGFNGDYRTLRFFQPGRIEDLSIDQQIVMRNKQYQWAPAMMFATAITALHRHYGFGGERIGRLNEQMAGVLKRYKGNARKIKQACYDITGVVFEIN